MEYRKSDYLNTCAVLLSLLFTSGLSVFLATTFSSVQPEPYMDEVFHVRQTMTYLHGNWTQWDPKITTPPGTYVLFWAVHQLLNWTQLVRTPTVCEFRCFNALLCATNHLVLLSIVQQLQPDRSPVWTSLVIVTNPVLFFFSALYYTDQCALLFTLLMIHLSLKQQATLSALVGAFGILVRQTNVVWLLLSVCILTGHRLADVYAFTSSPASATAWLGQLFRKTVRQPQLLLHILVRALHDAPMHFLVVGLFLLFIRWNGGIVLGDRSAHQAVFHVCQLWYFSVFCTLLTPCWVVKFVVNSARTYTRRRSNGLRILVLLLIFLMGIILSLCYTSFVHPYLLADNRHYTFYVWRKLIARSRITFFALSLVYLVCSVYWLDCLFGSALSFTRWLIGVATLLGSVFSLVPAGLLEPRYFIIPYTLWRLFAVRAGDHFRPISHLFFEICANLLVILVTSHVFCAKPFFWDHEPGVIQRFMW